MEKRNVVEERRTPSHDTARVDEAWDKRASEAFAPKKADSPGTPQAQSSVAAH